MNKIEVIEPAPTSAALGAQRIDAQTLPVATPSAMPAVITPAQLVARAFEQNASVEVMERLMALQVQQEQINAEREKREVEREQREAVKAFNAAFAAFRGEELAVLKDKARTSGPLSGQKYATLHSFVTATKLALSKHGLGVRWDVTRDEPEWIEVTCILKHAQGHFETVAMGGPPDNGPARNTLQARHSTVSYLERYTLKAICGLAEQDDDDDGNGGRSHRTGDDQGAAPGEVSEEEHLQRDGTTAADGGMDSLTKWWGSLTNKQRSLMNPHFGGMRKRAQRVGGDQ